MTEATSPASAMGRRRWYLHWLGKVLDGIRTLHERGYLDDEAREAIASELERLDDQDRQAVKAGAGEGSTE